MHTFDTKHIPITRQRHASTRLTTAWSVQILSAKLTGPKIYIKAKLQAKLMAKRATQEQHQESRPPPPGAVVAPKSVAGWQAHVWGTQAKTSCARRDGGVKRAVPATRAAMRAIAAPLPLAARRWRQRGRILKSVMSALLWPCGPSPYADTGVSGWAGVWVEV